MSIDHGLILCSPIGQVLSCPLAYASVVAALLALSDHLIDGAWWIVAAS